jgi:tRNA pseudouridine55 synthase
LARAGIVVDRPARPVLIEQLNQLDWAPPLLTLDILCGKGTYIRALARDLGVTLSCGAHLQALRRTAVGQFGIADATPLAALEADPALITEALLPPEHAVTDWPAVGLGAEQARQVRNGQPIALAQLNGDRARAHGPDGTLLALLERTDNMWKPQKVFDWS